MIAALRRLSLLLTGLMVTGCVTRSADVAPQAADPAVFAALSCAALDDEADRIRQRATRLAYAVDERSGNNIIALSLGVTVFWPLHRRSTPPVKTRPREISGNFDAPDLSATNILRGIGGKVERD